MKWEDEKHINLITKPHTLLASSASYQPAFYQPASYQPAELLLTPTLRVALSNYQMYG